VTTDFAVATMFDQFKWMTTGSIVSTIQRIWSMVSVRDSLPFWKLWRDLNDFFILQESTDLVYLGIPCMCNCWLLSLAYDRIVTYSRKMPWCALLSAVKNYNKSLEKLQDCGFKTETKTKTWCSRPRPTRLCIVKPLIEQSHVTRLNQSQSDQPIS